MNPCPAERSPTGLWARASASPQGQPFHFAQAGHSVNTGPLLQLGRQPKRKDRSCGTGTGRLPCMSDWGWNPDTFSALGTVGASLLGAIALLIAASQHKVAAKEFSLKAQARQVYVRIMRDSKHPSRYGPQASKSTDDEWVPVFEGPEAAWLRFLEVEVVNGSTGPVRLRQVISRHGWPEGITGTWSWNRTWNIIFGRRDYAHFAYNFLPPGSTRVVRIPVPHDAILHEKWLEITFSDAEGKHWTRKLDGKLSKWV